LLKLNPGVQENFLCWTTTATCLHFMNILNSILLNVTGLIFASVKLFTFIFSFYILYLSTVPCCTNDTCNDNDRQTQSTDTPTRHDDNCNNCSPFAICGNCSGFTFTNKLFQVETPEQLTHQTFTDYMQLNFPQYISSFWQPPKID
jgi:hypothetical protein